MKALNRFHAKHPRVSVSVAILIVFAIMLIACQWDRADTAAIRMQLVGKVVM